MTAKPCTELERHVQAGPAVGKLAAVAAWLAAQSLERTTGGWRVLSGAILVVSLILCLLYLTVWIIGAVLWLLGHPDDDSDRDFWGSEKLRQTSRAEAAPRELKSASKLVTVSRRSRPGAVGDVLFGRGPTFVFCSVRWECGVNHGDVMPDSQARENYEAYEAKCRAGLEREHLGRFALMHNSEVVNIYNDESDAYSIGCEKFGVGSFSLQEIGAKPVHLGSAELNS